MLTGARGAMLALTITMTAGLIGAASEPVHAQDTVRIGLPTKTYYPTIIAETAQRQGLFEKEGIKAELTIYRSGAETFEAMAAGAADLQLNSAALIAAGRTKGVKTKAVAGAATGYYGWYLMVKEGSPIKKAEDLAGKKVGITAAGSASDVLARWTMQDRKIQFTTVPVGGGGLVPNMLAGNVDAVVLYSPLSFQVMMKKQAHSLIDYGASVPKHLSGLWIASDDYIAKKPENLQKVLNALFGGVVYLQTHRDDAIKLIAEIDDIPPDVAAAELDGNLKHMSTTGEMSKEWMERALDLAKLVGMTNLAPVEEDYTTQFKIVPTKK
jgi:NitT/TauT family transport system substrate-binding protein